MRIDLPIANHPDIQRIFDSDARFKLLRKGRRVGATRSKANDWIQRCLSGYDLKFLWVDTIQRNVDRYSERFFQKPLKSLPKSIWTWNGQKKTLHIKDSLIDFGSAERPENLEGFGYDEIFLNEAGIILKGESGRKLWEETLRPMLSDREGGALFAGVPKGLRDNHFAKLWESSERNTEWGRYTMTSYDSPYVSESEVRSMEADMHPSTARQEIWAEFIDYAATEMPWLMNFSDSHIADINFDPNKPLILSFDFNIDPMVITCHHLWFDNNSHHWHTFDEIVINNGSVPQAIKIIKDKFPEIVLSKALITGDQTGSKRDINSIDHRYSWLLIKEGLRVADNRLKIPRVNPSVSTNRELCNYILYAHPDVKVSSRCKTLIYEAKYTEADHEGGIAKKNRNNLAQRADALDTWRYVANSFLPDFIEKSHKYKKSS